LATPRIHDARSNRPHDPRTGPRRLLHAAVFWVAVAPACAGSELSETSLFEHADQCYARGDYECASLLYERFATEHASSPLAPIARARITAIERELDAVMGRRGAQAPVFVRPFAPLRPHDEVAPAFAPVAAPEIVPLGN